MNKLDVVTQYFSIHSLDRRVETWPRVPDVARLCVLSVSTHWIVELKRPPRQTLQRIHSLSVSTDWIVELKLYRKPDEYTFYPLSVSTDWIVELKRRGYTAPRGND